MAYRKNLTILDAYPGAYRKILRYIFIEPKIRTTAVRYSNAKLRKL